MSLHNKKVLVSAGPTHEAIDPVRYVGNYSSGKMGFALAEAAAAKGAEVVLVAGPVCLENPPGVGRVDVVSADEMYHAVIKLAEEADVYISAAAVADYRPAKIHSKKVKKKGERLILELVPNVDILSEVANLPKHPILIGFAAETNDLLENAKKKLTMKHLDMIVANQVGKGIGFGCDDLAATILKSDGTALTVPLTDKKKMADIILNMISEVL